MDKDNALELAFLAYKGMRKDVAIKEAKTEVARSWNNLLLRKKDSNANQLRLNQGDKMAKSIDELFR
jgi:hypothetical protein